MAKKVKRLRCPVCSGEDMQKISPSDGTELMLDYCDKCGGMWFESGEVRQLRFCPPEVLSSLISMKKQLYAVECDSCGNLMTRNAGECPACGKANIIRCPRCDTELERVQGEKFTLDVCQSCRGVWFDNIDLSAVWNLQFTSSESDGREKDEITEDTVIAVLRSGKDVEIEIGDGDGQRNVFGSIADIIGGIFSHHD
ncbi:MAG: zf-TFIIB domain-containing protein [Gemmatimonadales bacterium]|jgi:Zn-finger nucleic acid-binding protein